MMITRIDFLKVVSEQMILQIYGIMTCKHCGYMLNMCVYLKYAIITSNIYHLLF